MRTVTRFTSLALSLLMLAAPMTGCTREDSRMDPELARQAFPGDPRMAEIALAVAGKDVDAVRRLAVGVDLDARGDKNVTLLQWAVLAGSPAGFEALLDAGADPHAHGMDGETAVHTAARSRRPEFLESLARRKADMSIAAADDRHSPLATALRSGNDGNVATLLRAGANPSAPDALGNTPLHIVGKIGLPGMALLLLDAGADPHATNARGHTFEHYLFDRQDDQLTHAARDEMEKVRNRLHGVRGKAVD